MSVDFKLLVHYGFFHKVPLALSMCLFKWIKVINGIISKSAHAILRILFILGLYNFLAYLECVISYAWSKGHSDPDLSSVTSLLTSLHFLSSFPIIMYIFTNNPNFLFDPFRTLKYGNILPGSIPPDLHLV